MDRRAPRRGFFGTVLTLTALACMAPVGLAGQRSPLSLEIRGGGGLPVASFATPPGAGEEMGGGPSFGLLFGYRRSVHTGIYVGFSQHRFDCARVGCPADGRLVQTGWDVGFRADLSTGAWQPRIRVGAVFSRVERDAGSGGEVVRHLSDLAAGFEAGVALAFPALGRYRLSPGLRYVWSNTRFPEAGLVRMRYVVADLGLIVAF